MKEQIAPQHSNRRLANVPLWIVLVVPWIIEIFAIVELVNYADRVKRGQNETAQWRSLILRGGLIFASTTSIITAYWIVTRSRRQKPAVALNQGAFNDVIYFHPWQPRAGVSQAILNALPDLIIRMHKDGTYLDFKASHTFPFISTLKVGANITNVLPPHAAQQRLNAVKKALATGEIQVYEFPLCVDGKQLWQEARVIPLTIDEVLIVVRDLTQRKQAEQALQEREAMLRAIGDNLPQGFIYQLVHEPDRGFYYSYISAGVEQLVGVTPAAVMRDYRVLHDRIVEADRERCDRLIQQSQQQLATFEMQVRKQTFWGTVQWSTIRAVPRRLDDGRTVWDGVEVDITEIKHTEEALRESEERFRKAFDDAPIGMALISPKGQLLKVNHALHDFLGYTKAELLTRTLHDITHPDDLATLEYQRQMLAGEIRSYQMEKRYLDAQGNIVRGFLSVSLVRDGDRQPRYFIAQILDLRDRHQIDRMKDEFVSIVSHELRTPLTAIRGSLGILESGVLDEEPAQVKAMLQIALHNSDRLVRLVNDILELERLDFGKVQLVKETCDVATLIQQAIESVQAIANEANIILCVNYPALQIWADPDAIVQTLINLLCNAIKFSPTGGTVWLNVQRSQANTSLAAPASVPASFIRFAVQDRGRGIPSDKLETIFGRFQQVDVSDSRQRGGTGLGLAICKSIVQQHGGKIWVESVLGEGSTFYFTLPSRQETV